VVAFLEGSLAPDARSSVEQHVAACSACAELVTWAAADQAARSVRKPGFEGRPFVGELHPGSRVARYQILGALGRGGMGEVYAAYHPDLDRRIALKVVHGSGSGSRERRVRLLREARAIARLSHPNVVAVHDAGTFGDRVFIVMELIDGQTVDQWLRSEPRTWQQVLDVFIAAGRGLAAAHAAGVIHRDFKPHNMMIGKNGVVRVMDFGLARLAQDDGGETRAVDDDEPIVEMGTVTKTGAFIGTPAYMSPEQFRREATDARSDQFSFCVALHEALFGMRPSTASAEPGSPTKSGSRESSRSSVPGWLRAIVMRGASVDREKRFGSMEQLISALERGRTRFRRRVSVVAVGVMAALVAAGAWRLAHANRFVCAVPQDRLAVAWAPGDAADPRRQSIHRAFAASGRATAETSWQRVSKVLDDYMTAWKAMYLQTCEATHVRGEQSAEVLDLRMSCLNDNLDQVRALTDAFVTADGGVVSHAVAAAMRITPVSRCTDVTLLKSAVALPKDEKTLREVRRLRQLLTEIEALRQVGRSSQALSRALALRFEAEAVKYPPVLGELLYQVGAAETSNDENPTRAEMTLRKAVVIAISTRDDTTAAKAMTILVYLVAFRLGRPNEAEAWAELSNAILDRIGTGQEEIRSWLLSSQAAARIRVGDFDGALQLQKRSLTIMEKSLGDNQPGFGVLLGDLSYTLTADGRPAEGLATARRAIETLRANGDTDGFGLAIATCNLADALNALGKYSEAETAYNQSIRLFDKEVGSKHPELAYALHGLGMVKLAQGLPRIAAPLLSTALEAREQPAGDPVLAADSEFGLARALWEGGGDRQRARSLAVKAQKVYREAHRSEAERAVNAWLDGHRDR